MGAWAKSLPPVMDHDDHRIYGEKALRNLALALEHEREGSTDWFLGYTQSAAANLRAWRKSLPKGERGDRQNDYRQAYGDAYDNRWLLRRAIAEVVLADEAFHPALWLRNAEAVLRTLGQRLMAEENER